MKKKLLFAALASSIASGASAQKMGRVGVVPQGIVGIPAAAVPGAPVIGPAAPALANPASFVLPKAAPLAASAPGFVPGAHAAAISPADGPAGPVSRASKVVAFFHRTAGALLGRTPSPVLPIVPDAAVASSPRPSLSSRSRFDGSDASVKDLSRRALQSADDRRRIAAVKTILSDALKEMERVSHGFKLSESAAINDVIHRVDRNVHRDLRAVEKILADPSTGVEARNQGIRLLTKAAKAGGKGYHDALIGVAERVAPAASEDQDALKIVVVKKYLTDAVQGINRLAKGFSLVQASGVNAISGGVDHNLRAVEKILTDRSTSAAVKDQGAKLLMKAAMAGGKSHHDRLLGIAKRIVPSASPEQDALRIAVVKENLADAVKGIRRLSRGFPLRDVYSINGTIASVREHLRVVEKTLVDPAASAAVKEQGIQLLTKAAKTGGKDDRDSLLGIAQRVAERAD